MSEKLEILADQAIGFLNDITIFVEHLKNNLSSQNERIRKSAVIAAFELMALIGNKDMSKDDPNND
jgi:hypothetical protein